jgi:hypothetical protein
MDGLPVEAAMSKQLKHTPGPWESDRNGKIWAGGVSLADTYACARGIDYKANARLIAAAPELLEACRLIVKYDSSDAIDGVELMINYATALDAAKEAIAKAGAPNE